MTRDTIAAVATAGGTAALAVVRLSGPEAIPIVAGLFRPGGRIRPSADPLCAVGHLTDGDRLVDRVVVWVYHAPRSYTGEDVVEICCHGGPQIAARILRLLLRSGARPAGAGEFTLRAFLNGKLDLAQAEAVEAVIRARSSAEAETAMRVLAGDLGRILRASLSRLIEALARIEAALDVQEDGEPDTLSPVWEPAGADDRDGVPRTLREEADRLRRLVEGGETARRIETGLRVVFAGRPNAGKSSLFNALAARDRAIVTPEPGATRDLLECAVEWDGLPVVLVDTAGLREGGGLAEMEGIRRARGAIATATLVVQVVDVSAATPEGTAEDLPRLGIPPERVVVALHKWDLAAGSAWEERTAGSGVLGAGRAAPPVVCSSVVGEPGVAPLRREIEARLRAAVGDPASAPVVGERQRAMLCEAHGALERASELLAQGHGAELVAFELRRALDRLGEILGERVGPRVLERVFSSFCVGK
jgi:tRNA modification GTPase